MLPFTTIAKGTAGSIDTPRNVVVGTAEEWTALWTANNPQAPPAKIDFARNVVVAVFLGARPTSGFEVDITAVRTAGGPTVVEYIERRPDPADVVAQVVTSPFHIVSLPRPSGPVEFRKIEP